MYLSDINISFNNKSIFNHADFHAVKGRVNIIWGESGSGKSTLIQTLLFRYPCKYVHDGIVISDFSEEERSAFLFEKVSCVYQEPLLIDYLSIRDNIEFTKRIHNINEDAQQILDYLNIADLLDKYPGELSGGEKTRVSLYIALLKSPEILILDEPTASLDEVNKDRVIRLLRIYSKEAIVICATHDDKLRSSDCRITYIKNNQLVSDETEDERGFHSETKKAEPAAIGDYDFIYTKALKYHPLTSFAREVILIAVIVFLFVSFTLNNSMRETLASHLNELSSRDLLVYRSLSDEAFYSYDGYEFPLNEGDVQKMKEIQGIEAMIPRIDFQNGGSSHYQSYYELYSDHFDIEEYFTKILPELLKVSIHEENGEAEYKDYSYALQTCRSEPDNTDGVYVTEQMYQFLTDGRNIEHPYISFTLPVPMYDCAGAGRYGGMDANGNELFNVDSNYVLCRPVSVTLPVAGTVMKERYEGIVIPEQVYMQYIDSLQDIKQEQTVYLVQFDEDHYTYYYDELPDSFDSEPDFIKEIRMTKWKPNAYKMTVSDLSSIQTVIDSLKAAGLRADSDYFDTQTLITVQDSTRKTMMIVSSVTALIVLSAYLLMQFIRKDRYRKIDEYLFLCGFRAKDRDRFVLKEWIYSFLVTALSASVLYFAAINILLSMHISFIRPKLLVFAEIFAMVFIIKVVFPLFLRKGVLNAAGNRN